MTDKTEQYEDEDDLDLTPEALKDLTASTGEAEAVAGGATTPGVNQCYCGSW